MPGLCIMLMLAQADRIQHGQTWQLIGAVGVAFGGLVIGIGLMLHREKEPKPNALPDWVAKVIGVAVILGGLLAACYVFWVV